MRNKLILKKRLCRIH